MFSPRILVCLLLGLVGYLPPANAQIITNDAPTPQKAPKRSSFSEKDKQLFLLLNVGLASPTGIFGSNDIYSDEAVYALPGLSMSLNVGRTFNRFIGITATGGYMMQNVRMAELVDNYNRFNANNEFIQDYEYPGMRFMYAAGGLLVSIPATDRFAIDIKLQAGIALGIDKPLTLEIEDITGFYLAKYAQASDIGFLPDLGLNMRVLVTDNFSMNFFTDFVMANFEFTDVTIFINGSPVGVYDYSLPMRNINVGIGAGWSF